MGESRILIKNATILSAGSEPGTFQGDILIENGLIAGLGKNLTSPDAETLSVSGLLAIPGFVQTHVHLCQTLFRNYASDLELLDWLRQRIWPLEAAHTRSSLAASASLGILELIKSGTTTILDFGSLYHTEAILEEVAQSGIRASVGITFMDEGEQVPNGLLRPLAESLAYFEELSGRWSGSGNGRIQLNFSPRFALSCSERTMIDLAERARSNDILLHTHASENRKEVEYIQQRFGLGNVALYHKLGMTGPNLCLAHCIWLDDEEIEILADTRTRVLHCPSANLKLGSGIANIPYYLEKNILCSLGADGPPCNNNLSMFNEMRLAGLIQKPRHGPTSMPAGTLVDMATIRGAETMHLENQIGTLEVGKKADLILLDLKTPHTSPGESVLNQLVYAAQPENVQSVIIDGKFVMRDRLVLTIDEEETMARAEEELQQLLKRAGIF